MARGGSNDRLPLRENTPSMSSSPIDENSRWVYEMVDFDSSDIGIQKSPLSSQYPPAYSSIWERDLDDESQKGLTSVNEYTRSLRDDSPTFNTTPPARTNGFLQFIAFLRRSGRYASHVSYENANPNPSGEPQKFSGWRGGVLAAAISSGTVLLFNLIFTIWAAAKSRSGIQVGTIYAGDCGKVRNVDSGMHVAINLMGTLLLGASNYTMQCLTSPTRKEVDAAHSKGKYLDIGLPSPKNLNGWKKKIVFTFLVLSTVPLHFLWNSAVFTTTQQLDYNVYVVTPNFLSSSGVDCSQNVSVKYDSGRSDNSAALYNYQTPLSWIGLPGNNPTNSSNSWYQKNVCNISQSLHTNSKRGLLTRLSNEDCIKTYGPGDNLLKGFGELLVVTKEQPANSNTTILMQFTYEMFVSNWTGNGWVCDPEYLIDNNYACKYKNLVANASEWTLGLPRSDPNDDYRFTTTEQWPIDYCLAQPTNLSGSCQLQYSLVIMIIVIIANCIKFSCILYLLWTHLEPILATTGDGIASFLERPDVYTISRPFLDRHHARKFRKLLSARLVPRSRRWELPKHPLRWWQAPSKTRWLLTLILCTVAIVIVSFLLVNGNDSITGQTDINPYFIGFGTYNQYATLTIFPTSSAQDLSSSDFNSNSILINMVAVANLPQVLVSCLYFAYNTVYTSMVSADEWSRFTLHRKALRTTNPRGEQRSTYWLSLPWTYALSLAIASSVLHWLISQSLFVARTEILDTYGNPEPNSYMEVGYSPSAILTALLFGSGMVVAMILNGFRKLKGGILVGNNSLAISAACHRSVNDAGAELRKVQWGALHHELDDGTPGHCCFSSEEVEPPRVGVLYI